MWYFINKAYIARPYSVNSDWTNKHNWCQRSWWCHIGPSTRFLLNLVMMMLSYCFILFNVSSLSSVQRWHSQSFPRHARDWSFPEVSFLQWPDSIISQSLFLGPFGGRGSWRCSFRAVFALHSLSFGYSRLYSQFWSSGVKLVSVLTRF